jgi:hypothetical protein
MSKETLPSMKAPPWIHTCQGQNGQRRKRLTSFV